MSLTAFAYALLLSFAAARLGAQRELQQNRPRVDSRGTCCLYSAHVEYMKEQCVPCDDEAPEDSYCGRNKYNCERKCGKSWCSDSYEAPTAAPTAVPTAAPTAGPTAAPTAVAPAPDGFCCFFAADATNVCGTCETMAVKGSWCAGSEDQCLADCGGDAGSATWCPTP